MTAATMPAKPRAFDGLRADWQDALPLSMWAPTFGWDYEGEPPVAPKWRVRRWKLLSYIRGYEERWRAIKALTVDPEATTSNAGTMWARSKWNRLTAVPLLLLAPVTWWDPDYKANVDELITYDGESDGYSWAATILYTPVGRFPFGRVYIHRESESTY